MLIIPGKVKLKDPDHTLCLLLNYSSNSDGEKCLEYIYFGRLVSNAIDSCANDGVKEILLLIL